MGIRVSSCWPAGLAVLTVLLLLSPAQASTAGLGPFPVRNFQPIQLLFLGMFGDRATVVPHKTWQVHLELAQTAVVFDEESLGTRAVGKFETLRSGLLLRYGLMERLELDLEIPFLYRYPGFMDDAIVAIEGAAGRSGGPRERLRGTEYTFDVSQHGNTLFSGTEGAVGLGDISMLGKYQVLDQGRVTPAVSVRLGVKVPTGETGEVFGSGKIDVGVGVALEHRVATRWIVYGNANGVFPTGTVAGLSVDPIFTGMGAIEYLVTPNFSVTAQTEYYMNPLRGNPSNLFSKDVVELTVGFSVRATKKFSWQVYGVEDGVGFGASADFTLATVLSYRFGP